MPCRGKIHGMAMTVETLPDDPAKLKKIILEQHKKIEFLMEQFNLARHKQFAASSESSPDQVNLFNEPEDILETPEQAEEKVIGAHTRRKPGRKPLPKELPRETRIVDIAEGDKICDCCSGPLHEMGRESSEQLEFIPAKMKVIETVRPKYSCRACEKDSTQTGIKIAPMPASAIPKSMATPSLLAQIIISKYQFALPLYRQETIFKQLGIELNRKTMANWVVQCANVLAPIMGRLKYHQLRQPVIHADETPLKVIQDDKQKSYMWVYCTGTDSPRPGVELNNIVVYDYHASRAATCPKQYLGDFSGYLQVDGYAAYEHTSATLVGCLAHARRKFIEAQRAQPKGKTGKADWAVNHLQKLYAVESKCKDCTPSERHEIRQEKSVPLLKHFKEWVDKSLLAVPPKSALGEALSYCARQWNKLTRYVDDGLLAIDNNRAERAIRPFVIGRKNWLFSNTSNGASASATLYSIIESAKANGIDPHQYLILLLDELPKRNAGHDLDELMPWIVKV